MKYYFKKNLISFLFIILSISVFCQDQSSPVRGIVAGTNKRYVISFNSGQTIVGKITSIDKETIYIKEGSQNPRPYNLADVSSVNEANSQYKASIGIGLGVSYGIFGMNGEFFVHPNISLNAGIGTAIFITPIFDAGGKIYFNSATNKWRPRLSVYYGTNSIIVHDGTGYLPKISNKYNNFSFGLGQAWVFSSGKQGLDLDIIYLIHNMEEELEKYENMGYDFDFKSPGHFKINIGYRFYF